VRTQLSSVDTATLTVSSLLPERPITLLVVAELNGQEQLRDEITLSAGETVAVACPLPAELVGGEGRMRIRASWDRSYGLHEATFWGRIDLRDLQAMPRLAAAPKMAGTLEGWSSPNRVLDQAAALGRPEHRESWQGPADHSAALHWAWDGANLLLGVRVRDDQQVNRRTGADIWNGDALQVAIASPGGELVNVALALTGEGVEFYQFSGPDAELPLKAAHRVTRHQERGETVYELSLPLASLGVEPRAGTIFGLNMVIFDDDDGRGQQRWLQMSPGLAGGRDVSQFQRFVLAE
jgi:hypothetical protein